MNKDLIKNAVNEAVKKSIAWDYTEKGVCIETKDYALTPWRFNTRLKELRNLASGVKSLRKNCSYKSLIATHKSADISKLLYSEIDTCQWILNDKIKYVYAFSQEDKMYSIMAKTYSGVLCQIEISTTLNDDTTPIVKHEIVGKEGMISDRSINEQVPVEAVYLFKDTEKHPEALTDTNLSSLGLTVLENQILDNIIHLLIYQSEVIDATEEKNNYKVIEAVNKSIQSNNKIILEEEQ